MVYGSSWDHVIIKYRDKNADKMSKNVQRKILMMSYDKKTSEETGVKTETF